jgi:hypothetical protein
MSLTKAAAYLSSVPPCVCKVKVKCSMCLVHLVHEALCHEDVWGSGSIPPSSLISALDDGGEFIFSISFQKFFSFEVDCSTLSL